MITRASLIPAMSLSPNAKSPARPSRVCASSTACGVSAPTLASVSLEPAMCRRGTPARESRSSVSFLRAVATPTLSAVAVNGTFHAARCASTSASCSESSGRAKSAVCPSRPAPSAATNAMTTAAMMTAAIWIGRDRLFQRRRAGNSKKANILTRRLELHLGERIK